MKVAFPTNEGEKIAQHASFCNLFLIIDTKTGEREVVDNPLKTETDTSSVNKDKSEGRHLGTGPIISQLLADKGVNVYAYLEAEANFLLHFQREGIDLYPVKEKAIEIVLAEIVANENEIHQTQKGEFAGLGRGMGLGRGFGRRAGQGRGFGRGTGKGYKNR